jgi:hypothetical protein
LADFSSFFHHGKGRKKTIEVSKDGLEHGGGGEDQVRMFDPVDAGWYPARPVVRTLIHNAEVLEVLVPCR